MDDLLDLVVAQKRCRRDRSKRPERYKGERGGDDQYGVTCEKRDTGKEISPRLSVPQRRSVNPSATLVSGSKPGAIRGAAIKGNSLGYTDRHKPHRR